MTAGGQAARRALPVAVLDLGLRDYDEVWDLQKRLVEERIQGKGRDRVILVRHPPVVTVGRGARGEPDPVAPGIPVRRIERGGKATYHGPGQLVGYPILRLESLGLGVGAYMRSLEGALIRALAALGVEAGRREGCPGVWVGPRKIASIGAALRRWVTYHGFALNVLSDPSGFRAIHPCGFDPGVMTSIEAETGRAPAWEAVKAAVLDRLGAEWGRPLAYNPDAERRAR